MATLNNKIFNLTNDVKELTKLTKEAWSEMMQYACLKALTKHRLEIMKFVDACGKAESKKHVQKLQKFIRNLHELENIPLTSATYIKRILTPLKQEREHFELFKAGSVTNVLSIETITQIETESATEAEALLAA